ncbi:hypothetical protein ABIB40_000670 [Pedobacter sp. UYP30]|uniref:type VI secretion system transmembrane protein TssO n=1 Tax=Pedobacter sp. UYP30 TaxID=1756400 RepID=UPI003396AEFE
MIKLTLKEKRERFLFFISVFVLAAAILCTAIFYNYNNDSKISKKEFSKRLQEENEFEEATTEVLPSLDSTYARIAKYNPNVQAQFLENDIKNAIGSIKSYYNRKPYDSRYKCFIYASKLYDNLFYDRKELKGNYNDIDNVNKLLNDCKLSTSQLQQSISAGAAR